MGSIEVYCSSLALKPDEPLKDRLKKWRSKGLKNIELGFYPKTDRKEFKNAVFEISNNYLIHNYFPPVLGEPIINLCSPTQSEESLELLTEAILYSASIGARYFSFHGGFIGDPIGKNDYGFIFEKPDDKSRNLAIENYYQSTIQLCSEAAKYGIKLLIENNVCQEINKGTLLFVTPDDFKEFFAKKTPANLGILLDYGHLKVSASSNDFLIAGITSLSEHIWGMHIHENEGIHDLHLPVYPDSECLNLVKSINPYYISLEGKYKDLDDLAKASQDIFKSINC